MIALWAKVTAATSLELAALSMLTNTPTLAHLASYFALHAMASTVVAFLAWALLPGKYKQPIAPAYALLWAFAFFIPALGVTALLLVVQIARRFPRILHTERYVTVLMPEFSGVQREATERSDIRAADARRILKDTHLPLETRLRVLVALQVMQPKAAVPLLMGLLSDPSEDIRLLAYSMVDTWEKDLVQQIQRADKALAEARLVAEKHPEDASEATTTSMQTPVVNALRRLAELHWQQADSGLARGDLRRFALESAQKFCEQVLLLDANVQGIWRLYARVLIELNQLEAAMRAISLARKLKMPAVEVWALMGQIAYLQRDFEAVRACAAELPANQLLPPSVAATAAYWRRKRIGKVDVHV